MNRITRLTRPRVTERIARAAEYPITAIIAPAGFGKSVALTDYLQTQRIEHVRYDVRADQNTLFEFVRGFAKALQPVAPAALGSFAGAQERAMASVDASADLSRWLLEHIKPGMTIVIDDLHNSSEDPRTIAFLATVIDRSPERVKWIVASRSMLDLPLASWIAYEKLDATIDENDLRFTIDEALAAAEDTIDGERGATELLELTSGWPVAFSIALRTSARIVDLQKVAEGTREMIYRYLAEQVYTRLPAAQQKVLLETCVYPSLDRAILEQRGDNPDVLSVLRRDAGFIYASSEQEYRYHDLFREFLESELRAKGELEYRRILCLAANTLQSLERNAEALSLFARAKNVDETLRLVETAGLDLIDRGRTDVIEAALATISEQRRAHHSLVLGIDAILASRRGQLDVSEQRYLLSIETAVSPATRAQLVYRYAIDLVRRGRAEAISLLEPYADDDTLDVTLRSSILATLATAHIRINAQIAKRYIELALTLLERSPNAVLRAKIYQQAAYVMFFAGEPERAGQYASDAVEICSTHALYEIASRAYSVLYNIAIDIHDDPIASLRYLGRIEECARLSGSRQMLVFALIAVYDIEAERGDDAALQRLDEQIADLEAVMPNSVNQSLLPARALRRASSGDFETAYGLLKGSAHSQDSSERKALRWAEIAIYAASCHANEDADQAMGLAYEELRTNERMTPRRLRTSLLLALSELIRGKDAAAHRLLSDVEKALQPSMRRLGALTRAVRALYNRSLDAESGPALAAALERLRAEELGGISRMLASLPIGEKDSGGLTTLTASERAILRALASGASSKLIASQTGRSPQTIDVHIRSICRKLGCRGRIEAIAVAINAGWLNAEP